MMCRFICIVFLCTFLLTSCGVPDKAFVLSGENRTEGTEENSFADVNQSVIGKNENDEVLDGKAEAASESGGYEGLLKEAGEAAADTEQRIFVYVCGAVVHPGVVELSADSRACDALEAAGGLLEEAQPDYVNLAARLEDAQKLYFPTKEEAVEMASETPKELSEDKEGLININTAGVEQLCTLPGIGEARANDIVAYRSQRGAFKSIEELMQVSGIKQSTFEKLRDRITVR